MAFLPLGKSVLPVVVLKHGKACDTVHTKVYNNGVRISLGEITESAEHLCHTLATRGLRLVDFASPHVIGIFRLALICLSHFRVRGTVFLLLVAIVILQRITITTSRQWNWPLFGGRRVALILTLLVSPGIS
jgi:hypothetical protein